MMYPARLILTLSVLTLLFSCEPNVTFDQPQPADISSLSQFPLQLLGIYQCIYDTSVVLKVTDKIIYTINDYDEKTSVSELDTNYRLIADTLIDLRNNEKKIVKLDGDSVVKHVHSVDTFFSISANQVLKKLRGYYFLNYSYNDQDGWEVKQMGMTHGQLFISTISSQEAIDKLKEISKSVLDSVPYQFYPTKSQFKKFVKANGFSEPIIFMKLK